MMTPNEAAKRLEKDISDAKARYERRLARFSEQKALPAAPPSRDWAGCQKAYDLRRAGCTFQQIGAELGVSAKRAQDKVWRAERFVSDRTLTIGFADLGSDEFVDILHVRECQFSPSPDRGAIDCYATPVSRATKQIVQRLHADTDPCSWRIRFLDGTSSTFDGLLVARCGADSLAGGFRLTIMLTSETRTAGQTNTSQSTVTGICTA